MNQKRKLTVEDLAAHERLAIEYTTELPPQVTAVLDDRPDPMYIAVNSALPPFEQHFSIGYAIGDYYLPRRFAVRPPWYQTLLNRKWKNHIMRLWMRATRRWFHREFDERKQNEVFALGVMITLGYTDDLRAYLEKHPEMTMWALFVTFVAIAQALKRRFIRALKRLFTFNPAIP